MSIFRKAARAASPGPYEDTTRVGTDFGGNMWDRINGRDLMTPGEANALTNTTNAHPSFAEQVSIMYRGRKA